MHDIPTSPPRVTSMAPVPIGTTNPSKSLPPASPQGEHSPLSRRAIILLGAALLICFSWPLYRLLRFAIDSSLYSYVLLVPFVSVYLFRLRSRAAPALGPTNRSAAAILIGVAVVVLIGLGMATASGAKLMEQDWLSVTTLSFVLMLAGACALILNKAQLQSAAFPLGFLIFLVPFPVRLEHAIESFLQHGSAPPAYWLYKLAGTPVFRQDMVFQLPGMTLQIAPECSGIRSTVVLFITSLIAGYLFLRSPGRRAILCLAVIPLALLRNGFRVFVIGELCVHVGPHMIDSSIHHQGGPIFFALSLIPFSGLIFYLVKSDRRASNSAPSV